MSVDRTTDQLVRLLETIVKLKDATENPMSVHVQQVFAENFGDAGTKANADQNFKGVLKDTVASPDLLGAVFGQFVDQVSQQLAKFGHSLEEASAGISASTVTRATLGVRSTAKEQDYLMPQVGQVETDAQFTAKPYNPLPVSKGGKPSAKNNPKFIAAISDPTRDTGEIAQEFGYSPGYVGRARAASGKKYNPTSATPGVKSKSTAMEESEVPLHLAFDAQAVTNYEKALEEKNALEKSIAELSKKRATASDEQMGQLKEQEKAQIKKLKEVKARLQVQTSLPPTGLFSAVNPDDISDSTHSAMQAIVKQAADVLGHSSVRDPRARSMAQAAKGGSKDQTLRALEQIFSQVFMRNESGDVTFLQTAHEGDSYSLAEVQDLMHSIMPAVRNARNSGIYPVTVGTGSSISALGNIVPNFSQDIMGGQSSDSDSPDTPHSMRVRGGTNYITKKTSDTYLGRQALRTSMGRRSSDYREVAQGADAGEGTQVVGFEAKHVFPNKVAMDIEERVKEQERIVRQQLEEGDVVDMQVGDKTYKVPRHIAENRLAMMRSVDRASEHTGLTRMGNERGPRGALEGSQSTELIAGLHLGKMFESIVGTGNLPKDLTERFLQSTSHQGQDDILSLPGVKPEQQVNNARLFAERHKEKLAYQQSRLEQSFATNTGQSATQNLGQEIIDLAMQQKLIDELLHTPEDKTAEEAQAQRRGEILYPKQHAANLANPGSPQHNIPKLSSDEALALLYGHSIAGVTPYSAAFMNIREQALPVQQLVESTGGTTSTARRYDQYSPVARIIEAARNQDPEELARLQGSLVPENYQDELNKSGTNTAKKIDGREVDVAHTSGMVEKDLSYTINDMFGLSSQKHHNIFNALHYAGKASDENGNLLPPAQLRQSLGARTAHGLASIHRGAQDLQDTARTGIPIVEYAKLATQVVPKEQEESHRAMLDSIHQVSPALAELSNDQLHALSNVKYGQGSEGGQQAITQVIKIVGSSIQKKLKEAIQHQAKKAGLNEEDTKDLFVQNAAGRVPQGFESLFREFNLFDPSTIESNPEFNRAIGLLMAVHEQTQGGQSLADFTAHTMGTAGQLSGLRTGVANVTANPAEATSDHRYGLLSSARSFAEDEAGKAPPAMARHAALAAAEIPRLSEELVKAKKATAELKKRHESASGSLKLNLKLKLREAIAKEKEAERALLDAHITSDPSQIDKYFSKQNAIVNSPTATEQERSAAQTELAASQQISELTAQNPDITGGSRSYLGVEHGYAGKTQTERLAGLQEHLDLRQKAQGGNARRVADLARFERTRQRRIDDVQGSDNIEFADNVNGFVGVSVGTNTPVSASQRDLVQGTSLATFISNEAMLDRNQDEAYAAPVSFAPLEKAATSLTERELQSITAATPEELLERVSQGQADINAHRDLQRNAHTRWLASLTPEERNHYLLTQSQKRTSPRATSEDLADARSTVQRYRGVDPATIPDEERFKLEKAKALRKQHAVNLIFDRYDRKASVAEAPTVPEPDNSSVRLAKMFAATKQLHEERRKTNVNYIVPEDAEIMQQVQQIATNQLDETSIGVPRQSAANEQRMQQTIATMTQEDRQKRRANQRPVTAKQLATARQHYNQYAGKEGLTQEETQKLSAAQIIMQRHAMQQITKNFGDDTTKGIPQLFDMITSMSPRPGDISPVAMQRRGVATTVASLVDSLGPDQLKAAQNLDFSRADSRIWMANTFPQFVPIMAHLDSIPNVRQYAGRQYNGLTSARKSRRRAEAADAAIAAAATSAKPTYFDLETNIPRNAAGEDDKSLNRTIFQASVLTGDRKKPTVMYAAATKEIAKQIETMAAEANATNDPTRRDEIIKQMHATATTDVYGKTGRDVDVNPDVIQSLVAHALTGGTVYDQETIKDRVKLAISGSGAVIGHNLKGFDLPVLYSGGMDQAAKDAVPEDVMNRVTDTLELSRDIAPGEHKLIDSYKRFVDPAGFTGAHDAGQDVLATRALHRVLGRRRTAVGKLDMSTIPAALQPYVIDSKKISVDDPRAKHFAVLTGTYRTLSTMEDYVQKHGVEGQTMGAKTMENMEKMFPGISSKTPEEAAELKKQIQEQYLDKYQHLAVDGSFYSGSAFLRRRTDFDKTDVRWGSYAGMRENLSRGLSVDQMVGASRADPARRAQILDRRRKQSENRAYLADRASRYGELTSEAYALQPHPTLPALPPAMYAAADSVGTAGSFRVEPKRAGDTAGTFAETTSTGPTATRSTTHRMGSYGAGGAGGGSGSGGGFTMSGGGDVPGGGGGGPVVIHVGQAEIYVQNGNVAGMSGGGGGKWLGGSYTGGGVDTGVESTDKDPTTEGAFSVGVAGSEASTRKTGARDPFVDPAATAAGSTATVGEATISSLDGVTSLSTPSLVITSATIQQIQTSTMSITSTGGPISVDGSASISTGKGTAGGSKRGGYDPGQQLIVNSLDAARSAYDQSGGLYTGKNLFDSKKDLTGRTIDAAKNLLGMRTDSMAANAAAALGTLADPTKASAHYADVEAGIVNVGSAATIEQASAAMLQLLNSLEQLASVLANETGPEVDAFRDDLMGTGKLASIGTTQLNKTAKTQQQTESLQIGKMEERVQAAVTQPGFFNFGRRREDKKAALSDFAEGFLGKRADTLYDEKTASLSLPHLVETTDASGKRVLSIDARKPRTPLERVSDKDLQRHAEYLNQLDSDNPVTFESLSKTQRAYARAQQSQNQSPFADKMFYAISKIRDLQFIGQNLAGIPQIPQQITQMLEMATSPALSAERTMTTARSLSQTPEVYNAALSAAAGQQARFGGSLSSNVGKITDFIPLTNAYGVDMTKSLNVARKLAAFDPQQGMQGASIALKEFLSGNVSSLSRRFEINRSALSKINTGDATAMLDSLDNVLSSMGVTDKLIDDQANTMATKYDKMVGRLDIIGQNLSGMLVNAVTPALESMLGSDSGLATTTGNKTLSKLTSESLQSYGDAALSNKVTGLSSLDPYADPTKFNKDLDNVLRMANNEIAVQARGYSSGTGLVPQLAPYRMMENASATQRFSMQHSVMKYLDQGMSKEQAYLQALRENQGDFNTSQEFLFQRNPINGLNMSAPDQYLGGLVKTKPGNLTLAGVLPKGPDLSTLEAQARIFGTYDTLGTMSAATPGGLNQQQIDIIGGIADKGLMLESMGANKAIPEKVGTLAASLPGSSMIPGVSQLAAFATNNVLKNMSTPELAKLARKMGTAAYATVQRRLDNDTVELLDEYGKTFTARISNIDAPEHTAAAGNTSVPKNDVLGRAMGLTQADYVITQADRNEYLKQAQASGMTEAQAKKMIDSHGYDKTLIKVASQPKVLAVGDSKDRYERQLASLFTTDKNGNLVAVNRKMAELGGAPVAFSGLPEEARTAMDVLAKNAADTKLGAINTQAAGLDLGGNAIISQQARDAYFQRHYLSMGGTLGFGVGTGLAAGAGTYYGTSAIAAASPGLFGLTAGVGLGTAATVGGVAAGVAALGYGAYAYSADMNDTSVAKQRELYEIQAKMNTQENQRRRSMNYVYNAGLLPNTKRAIAAATTGGGEEFAKQLKLEALGRGNSVQADLTGLTFDVLWKALTGQTSKDASPTNAETQLKQDANTQVALDMADEVSKEMEKTKDEFAKRRETAPDSVKKVYDRMVINPMDPGTAERPNYISVLDLQQTLTAIDTVAASSSNEQFQKYADTPEYVRARAAIANQTADPEKQKINDLLEKNKITIPRRILKGGPDYIRNRLTSAADAESFTFNTDDMLQYSAAEQDNIYRYGLDQLGSLRNYSQPAKEYQDQAMGKMVGLRNQRFTSFMDANALNAMFMGSDNTTSPIGLRGTSGVKAAALNMLDQSYFIKNNAGDQGQINEVRSAQTAAVDAMLEQARAFKEQADMARPFTTLYKSTFANLIMGMNIAKENFQQIFDTMGQGNPLFAIDFAKQSTGLDWKQSIASQLYVPGFNQQGVVDPTQSGFPLRPGLMAGTFQVPYATGPRASIRYANDLLNDKKTTGMLNPAEMLNIFQSAAQGQTEIVRRQIQFNNQMRDLNLNHNRALEDIARNGMRQLEDIHTNYTRQMIQLTQQNEISKRMDRASVNKNIESADITQADRVQAHVVQESGQMFARHAGQSNPQGFLARVQGTALENDPQVVALREALAKYNSISYDNSGAKQAAWDKVIEARNPLEGRIKQMMQGANPTDTANYESYLALLGRDPAREAQAQTYSNQRTSQFVETAAERKSLLKQKEDLLYQQSGEGLTRRQLQKSMQDANASGDPLQIAAAKKAMDDFDINSQKTADAIALVSQKLSAISNTSEMFADAWTEAFANITNNASTTVLGLVQSLDDFNKKMQQQLDDQDIQFGRQVHDLKQAFIDAAREIATQVPGEMAKGYTAVMTYMAEQSRAEALMLSGNYEDGKNQMFANMNRLGDALYGTPDSDAKKVFLANLEKNIPASDKTATGVELPSNGIAAALAKVNGKWALRVTYQSGTEDSPANPAATKPEDNGRPRGSFTPTPHG